MLGGGSRAWSLLISEIRLEFGLEKGSGGMMGRVLICLEMLRRWDVGVHA